MNTGLLTDSVLSRCKSQVGDENLGSCETFAALGYGSLRYRFKKVKAQGISVRFIR